MRGKTPLFVLFVLLITGTLAIATPSTVLSHDQGLESLKQTGMAFRSVVKKVSPAVVFIKVEKEVSTQNAPQFFSPYGSPFDDEFFRYFFGEPPEDRSPQPSPRKRQEVGQGSGFLTTPDGYILTNNHVVGDSDRVYVQMHDGREYQAEIIGSDPGSDLAVIKINESDLPFLQLGNSEDLEVGDWVLAVGNPFGLSHTLTAGIVSAKGRSGIGLSDYEDFIQTDAAINPGNSGGPLVNLEGDVIGINTAIFSRSGGYMGIGFAIPINMAKDIRDQLIEHGEVRRGRLGIYIQDITQDLAQSFELDKVEGILITQVVEKSPAEDAGLQRGDIVLEIDGDKVVNVANLRNRISLTPPGSNVNLTILRDGDKKDVRVRIGKLDSSSLSQNQQESEVSKLGLSLHQLTPELADRYGYENEKGVLISNVEGGSAAYRAGLKNGDLILQINRQAVSTVEDAIKHLRNGVGNVILLLVRRGDSALYVALKTK